MKFRTGWSRKAILTFEAAPHVDTFGEGCTRPRKPPVQRPCGGTGPGVIKEARGCRCGCSSQCRAEWDRSRGGHRCEPRGTEGKAERRVCRAEWGALTNLGVAEGRLRVGRGTGTRPAGGRQPQQQQGAGGQGRKGGHGGFCGAGRRGQWSSADVGSPPHTHSQLGRGLSPCTLGLRDWGGVETLSGRWGFRSPEELRGLGVGKV